MKSFTTIILLLILPSVLKAQIIFTDSIRHELRKHLFANGDALDSDTYSYGNLWIRSLMSNKLTGCPDEKTDVVDILEFQDASPHNYAHILLVAGEKSRIINMRRTYAEILQDLLDFFARNPEIDDRLLPLFSYKIYLTFLQSTTKPQLGKWYNWWHQRDSLSRQLEIKYDDWIDCR